MIFSTQRQLPARAGRPTLVLSALLLLAFDCLPASAAANSGIQYEDAPPTVTGDRAPGGQQPPAGKSDAGGSGSGGGTATGKGGSGKQAGGGNARQGGQAGSGATGERGQGDAAGDGAGGDEAEALAAAPASSDGGGSSPLVPILIAIAVLAAISIGAVMIRRHRGEGGEDSGPDVSPEAS